jgi:hypothetical protein
MALHSNRVPMQMDLERFLTVENGLTWGPMPGGVVKTCSNRILSGTEDM